MIFPFLVKPFSRLGSTSRGLVALFCFVGYLGIAWYITPYIQYPKAFGWPTDGPIIRTSINVAYQFGYLRCLCGFILGMMLYYGYKENWGRKFLANGYVMLLLGAGVFLTMHFFVSDLLIVSFFPFILLSGAYGSKSMAGAISLKRNGPLTEAISRMPRRYGLVLLGQKLSQWVR